MKVLSSFLRQLIPYTASFLLACYLSHLQKNQLEFVGDISLKLETKLFSKSSDSLLLLSVTDLDDKNDAVSTLNLFQKSTTPLSYTINLKAEDGTTIPYSVVDKIPKALKEPHSFNILVKLPTEELKNHSELSSQLHIASLLSEKATVAIADTKKL